MSTTAPAPYPRLLADIGGTSARFGCIEEAGGPIAHPASYACAEYEGMAQLLERYRDACPRTPQSAAIGVAAAVIADAVTLTNRPWTFSIAALRRRLDVERLSVLNDFEALALGLRTTPPEAVRRIGGGAAQPGAPIALLGPGTGFGVAGLLTTAAGEVAVVGEGGHASLAAADPFEARIVEWLRGRFGHVSVEHALSGDGIVNLYCACCALAGALPEPIDDATITARASDGSDQHCRDALGSFFGFLGGFAGDLALTLGARGGVFIGGGIVPRLGAAIDASTFRERFEAKGRLRPYVEKIATHVLLDPAQTALRGADAALDRPG